tara:strand:+ start:778 stop:951 length:174 start_codon:yes stop_codon:yes gene_type:complete
MQKYIVTMEETVVTVVTIAAESMDEAEELVLSGKYANDDVVSKDAVEGYINSVKKVI